MKQKKGFSLVELLIVIGIIAVLGGVMLTQFSGSTESALAASCLNNMRSLCNAVISEATQEGHYPSAGPYQYLVTDSGSVDYAKTLWRQGWIGQAEGNTIVSCYYDSSDDQAQHYAITNGTLWRAVGGNRSTYVCPAHVKMCKKKRLASPAWSYAMNSYFGWDCSKGAGYNGLCRKYGEGDFNFRYSSGASNRSRPPDRVLLFGEIPFAENGVQQPEFSTAAASENDMILEFANAEGGVQRANRASTGAGEAIGFNHKSGNDYSAHVAFADGHCVKLMLPRGGSEDNLVSLTTWLCTGQEYTFNGAQYEKVAE